MASQLLAAFCGTIVLAVSTVVPSACAQSNDLAGEPLVPSQFRGEWNVDLSACGTDTSDTRLQIGADSIRFWESEGPVTEIKRHGVSEFTATVRLSGEGESWNERLHFRLSPDGKTLIDLRPDSDGFSRKRCP